MRTSITRVTLACLPAMLLAGCGSEHPAPTLPLPPITAPTRTYAPVPTDWRDRDLTPGDWRWQASSATSVASYGPAGQMAMFIIRCDIARRVVRLSSITAGNSATSTMPPGQISTGSPMLPATHLERQVTITTTSAIEKRLGLVDPDGASLDVVIASTDNLLDRIVHSQGRFMFEVEGGLALILPTAGETARAVEDCRI